MPSVNRGHLTAERHLTADPSDPLRFAGAFHDVSGLFGTKVCFREAQLSEAKPD
jgi:hypothetical protein